MSQTLPVGYWLTMFTQLRLNAGGKGAMDGYAVYDDVRDAASIAASLRRLCR